MLHCRHGESFVVAVSAVRGCIFASRIARRWPRRSSARFLSSRLRTDGTLETRLIVFSALHGRKFEWLRWRR